MIENAETLIRAILQEAEKLICDAYFGITNLSHENALAQTGLRNGAEIVRDYIAHGEPGLAFEHLLYMITEAALEISSDCRDKLYKAGNLLGFSGKNLINKKLSTYPVQAS